MTSISYIRYITLKTPFNNNISSCRLIVKVILLSSILSLFWTVVPLLGWSYYTLEDNFVSCTIKSNDGTFNVISYNITILIFVFILPLIIIIITNMKSLILVRVNF